MYRLLRSIVMSRLNQFVSQQIRAMYRLQGAWLNAAHFLYSAQAHLQEEIKMKKKKIAAFFLATALTLSSCGSNNSINKEEKDTTNSTTNSLTQTSSSTETEITTVAPETTEATSVTLVDPNRKTVLRNVCWGDTIDVVKSVETDELIYEEGDSLLYSTSIADCKSQLIYDFDKSHGLYSVTYLLDTNIGNGLLAITKYNNVRDAVTAKYGSPKKDTKKTISSLSDYCDNDGQALELGYIAYVAHWDIENTSIDLLLATVDYKLNFGLMFKDTTFTPPTNTSGL